MLIKIFNNFKILGINPCRLNSLQGCEIMFKELTEYVQLVGRLMSNKLSDNTQLLGSMLVKKLLDDTQEFDRVMFKGFSNDTALLETAIPALNYSIAI